MWTLINYIKGLWTNLAPTATKTKLENIENGVKALADDHDKETIAGRTLVEADTAADQRTALDVDSKTEVTGKASSAQAAAIAAAALDATTKADTAQADAEATAADALAAHVAAPDPHEQYAKETEVATSLAAKADLFGGKIPSSQLQSYVDDVLEYDVRADFPEPGEAGKIYLDKEKNLSYRWALTTYVVLSASLALGETSETAFRGDQGKTAYDFSQSAALVTAKVTAGSEGTAGKLALSSVAPAALGVAAKGASAAAAKADHVHQMPTLDEVGEGATYKRMSAAEKTALAATSAQAPWTAPTIFFPDQERAKLERASGGRATIFYSADGLKTPCEVVLLPAFALSDVSPYFSRTRGNSTAYVIGELLQANGQLYEVTTPGTTGAAPPVYGVNVGDAIFDGTATLTLRINAYNDIDPAFVVAGVKKAGWWVGRFQAAVSNGKPLVIPGQLPASVTIDNMRAYCATFGGGCRPMTGLDWSAIQKDALQKGVVPVGNTNYGRSHKATESQWGGIRGDRARPGDSSVTTNPYTLGGSGGKLWTHNREEWGIHDFVGNMWQWTDGYKIMDGQLYIAAHDNDPTLLTAAGEATWIATGIFFDSPVAGDDAGSDSLGTPRLDAAVANYTASVVPTRDFATIKADTRDLDYAAATWSSYGIQAGYDAIDFLARRTAFLMGLSPKMRVGGPVPFSASEGYGYVRNNGERFAYRGGYYYSGSNAGPSYCYFSYRRSNPNAFRPVFPV